jgi:hypothetical protein
MTACSTRSSTSGLSPAAADAHPAPSSASSASSPSAAIIRLPSCPTSPKPLSLSEQYCTKPGDVNGDFANGVWHAEKEEDD